MAGFARGEPLLPAARRTTTGRTPCSRWCTARTRTDCEATIDAIRDRDRRRRVLPAVVGQGVQEGAACATSRPSGTSGAPSTSPRVDAQPATLDARGCAGVGDAATTTTRRRSAPNAVAAAAIARRDAAARAARRRERGSPPRWCARLPARVLASGRWRPPTGARGTARPPAATSPRPLAHSHVQHPLERLRAAAPGTTGGAAAARRRPRCASQPSAATLNTPGEVCSTDQRAQRVATSSTCTTCTGGAAPRTRAAGGRVAGGGEQRARRPARRPARCAAS